MEILIGAIISAVISYLVSLYFYKKATDDLNKQTKILNEKSNILGNYIEIIGAFIENTQNNEKIKSHFKKDTNGHIIGLDTTIKPPPAEIYIDSHLTNDYIALPKDTTQ